MKKKMILLGFLLVIFVAFIISRFIVLNSQNIYGRIKIVSSPEAGVFIDNVPAGKTPFENKYKTGEYTVKLIPEGNSTQTASWQGKVKVYKNALTFVNRELGASDNGSAGEILTITKMEKPPENSNFGEVYVETEPNGAIVYLDNDEKGTAPFILERVLKGDHEISAFMPGFLRRTQKINVTPGYRVNVSFKLALDAAQQKNTPTPVASGSADLTATPSAKTTSGITKTSVVIGETPVGFLRVRTEPSTSAAEVAQVKPGETYELLEEQSGWYKIKLTNTEGWVSSIYAVKKEQ